MTANEFMVALQQRVEHPMIGMIGRMLPEMTWEVSGKVFDGRKEALKGFKNVNSDGPDAFVIWFPQISFRIIRNNS